MIMNEYSGGQSWPMQSKPSGQARRPGDPAGRGMRQFEDCTEEQCGSWNLEGVPQPDLRGQEGARVTLQF